MVINMENKPETINISKSSGFRILFRNKDFLSLWLGQVFSQLGDRVTFVIFAATIAGILGSSLSFQCFLYIAFTIPAILLTSIAGVFIDRWNKKNVLIVTNILRALFIALLPFFTHSPLQVYFLAFLISAVTQFFVPAEASCIPELVNKRQLLAANSMFTTTMMGSLIFGLALGDPLINIFGINSVHYAISGFFLISALCITLMNKKNIGASSQRKTFVSFLDELKEGFLYIKNNSPVLHAMLKLATLFSIIVMMGMLAMGISQQELYPNEPVIAARKFVYIIAFSGIGMIFGAFTVGKWFRNINKYVLIFSGFMVIGSGLCLLSLVGNIPNSLHFNIPGYDFYFVHFEAFKLTYRMIFAYAVSFVIGLGSALVAIPVQTILHSLVPEDVRGKVFGVQFTLLSASSTMPAIVAGLGADAVGVSAILLLIGLPLILFGLYNLVKSK